jgi:hypothetical protein
MEIDNYGNLSTCILVGFELVPDALPLNTQCGLFRIGHSTPTRKKWNFSLKKTFFILISAHVTCQRTRRLFSKQCRRRLGQCDRIGRNSSL